MELLRLFGNNLLPVFLAAGAGYLLVAITRLDARPVTHVAFYVFAPCLIFRIIADSEVPGEALVRMAAFATISLLVVAALAAVAARMMGCSSIPGPVRDVEPALQHVPKKHSRSNREAPNDPK